MNIFSITLDAGLEKEDKKRGQLEVLTAMRLIFICGVILNTLFIGFQLKQYQYCGNVPNRVF